MFTSIAFFICTLMAAAAAAGRTDAIIASLRTQLDTAKTDLRNYKNLYESERRENRQAVQRINELQAENDILINEQNVIQEKLDRFEQQLNALKVPRGYKKYHQLKSPSAKWRRKAQFKRCLKSSNGKFT